MGGACLVGVHHDGAGCMTDDVLAHCATRRERFEKAAALQPSRSHHFPAKLHFDITVCAHLA